MKHLWKAARTRLKRIQRVARYTVLLLLLLLGFFLYSEKAVILDRTRHLICEQLSGLLEEEVTISDLRFDLFSFSAEVIGIRVEDRLGPGLPPLVEVDRISVRIDPRFSSRHIRLHQVELIRPRIRLDLKDGRLVHFSGLQTLLDEPSDPDKKGPRVDIGRLTVDGAEVSVSDSVQGWSVALEGLGAVLAVADGRPGESRVTLRRGAVATRDFQENIEYLRVEADLSTTPSRLQGLSLGVSGASLEAQGEVQIPFDEGTPFGVSVTALVRGDLSVINRYLPDAPRCEGEVDASASVTLNEELQVSGSVNFQEVRVDDIRIGSGSGQVTFEDNRIQAQNLILPRGGGWLRVDGELGLSDRLPLKAHAELLSISLGDLLEDLTIRGPWVDLMISGEAEVEGTLDGPLLLSGKLDSEVRDFGTWSRSFRGATPNDLMVSLDQARLRAGFVVTPEAVRINDGMIETARSKLELFGQIGLEGSLDLGFNADGVSLNELSPVAGISIGGELWGKGRISGPFEDLVISTGKDTWIYGGTFDTYVLGDVDGEIVVPLNSTAFLQGVKSRPGGAPDGRRPESQLSLGDAGLVGLLDPLDRLDRTYYGGSMGPASPAMMLFPRIRTRVGATRAAGRGAIVFHDPTTLYFDLALPQEEAGGGVAGRVADLLAIAGANLEGNPVDGAIFGTVEVMGPPRALDGSAALEIRALEAYGQTIDTVSAQLALEAGDLVSRDLVASIDSGRMTVQGRLNRDGSLAVQSELQHLPIQSLNFLGGADLIGEARSTLDLKGSLDRPEISGEVAILQVQYGGKAVGDTSLTLQTRRDILAVTGQVMGDRAILDLGISLLDDGPYSLIVAMNSLLLDPFLPAQPADTPPTSVLVQGNLNASGTLFGEGDSSLELDLDRLSLTHRAVGLVNRGQVQMSMVDGAFIINPVVLEGPETYLRLAGEIGAPDEDGDRSVDIDFGGNVNLGLLDAIVPGIFLRLEGQLELGRQTGVRREGFHIGGSLSALRLAGDAKIREGAIRSVFFPPTIDQITSSISVRDNNEIVIRDFEGTLGGGSVNGKGTILLGADYYPRHYDLQLDGKDAFVRYPSFLPPGLMSANLKFYGEVGSLLLSGDIYEHRMVYRERYNWEKSLTDFRTYRLDSVETRIESEPYFGIDINIHAPGTFFIRNNLGNVQLKGDLQLVGNTSVLYLYGDVESVRGSLRILDNNFELTEGKVDFSGDYWNPTLDLRMQTQIDSYTIFYRISGTLQYPLYDSDSDAGLSQRDIHSLIVFGTLADNITGGETLAIAAPTLEFLMGRFGSGLLDPIQQLARLESFSVVPVPDQAGNIGVRFYGEKELIQNKLMASGYYDYALNGNQEFLTDLEWRTLDCCSVILRLESDTLESSVPVNPGLRLKLKLEFE